MSSTNKTTYYELSQYVGTDKPTYLTDYNGDMRKIDTALHDAATDASDALTTANSAASVAADAAAAATTATNTANSASETAQNAKTTAETASANAAAALAAATDAETAAEANTIENLAPAYDPTLTYEVGDLVTYIDAQGSGKLYKCIVTVSVPEAFNINKWDDVTTSEIYGTKLTALATATSDGVKSYGDLFQELTSVISQIADKTVVQLAMIENNVPTIYIFEGFTAFGSPAVVGANFAHTRATDVGLIAYRAVIADGYCDYKHWTCNTTGNTLTSDLNSVPAAGRSYIIYG